MTAAAYAAGAITVQSAWTIAFHRGRLSQQLLDADGVAPQRMGMMAVGLSASAFEPYLRDIPNPKLVVIACYNGPQSVTASGERAALEHLRGRLEKAGVLTRMVKVAIAYHSHYMDVVADEYIRLIAHVRPEQQMTTTMISSVTGKAIESKELDPAYWARNMRSPVRFEQALVTVFSSTPLSTGRCPPNASRIGFALEIGPHATLQGPLMQLLVQQGHVEQVTYTSMLCRGENAYVTSLRAAGKLWSHGQSVDLIKANRSENSKDEKVLGRLPAYPWKSVNLRSLP
jgi:acyl transferase domain-containing protein